MSEPAVARNCPFYGHHLVFMGKPFVLVEQGGNECAIIVSSYSPCRMEIEGKPVDWRECPQAKELVMTLRPVHEPDDEET